MTDPASLRILMTNIALSGRSGTETVTRDLALGYLNAGHRPCVYTRQMGPIAEELIARSIPVTDSVSDIAGKIDVIHGHHLNACLGVMAKFPTTPAISVCHDFTTWYDVPPKLANIRRYVAVSANTRERLIYQGGIAESATRLVLNGVDTERFKPGPVAEDKPRTALAFAKNAGHVEAIRQVCAERDIKVDFVGQQAGVVIDAPENVMGNYDLIFASARTAIEAMACDRPVIVCDGRGLAGMIDPERYRAWQEHNFGLKVLLRPVSLENLEMELDRYDPRAAAEIGRQLRLDASVKAWVDRYVSVLHEAMSDAPPTVEEAAAAMGEHLERWSPRVGIAWPWAQERQALIEQRDQLSTGLEPLALDTPLGFGAKTGWFRHARLVGFHGQEEWGLWSGDRNAYIRLAVREPAAPLELEIVYMPFVPTDGDLVIEVHLGALRVATWTHTEREHTTVITKRLHLPIEAISSATAEIIFRTNTIARASDRGGADTRCLGIGLTWLTLRSAQQAANP